VIRRAAPDDAPAIAAVLVRAWQRDYADIVDPQVLAELDVEERTQVWRGWLGDDEVLVWVAEEGGRVVGFASLRGAKLTTLYVDPFAQGAGVGTQLLAAAEAAGASELEVFEANGHGRHFYEARGWSDAGASGEWLDRPLRRYVRPYPRDRYRDTGGRP
jgi:ribosomal protein S18 acetylase RimI-like enzyme